MLTVISPGTWRSLTETATTAVAQGWAAEGVFATAVGPHFVPGAPDTLFYVGKAGGPLIDAVGVTQNQVVSADAAVTWMLQRRNPSAFWVFADLLSPSRELIAWSNVAKIDTRTPSPPNDRQWSLIGTPCLRALREEFETLRPARSVFAISDYQRFPVIGLLKQIGFSPMEASDELDGTEFLTNRDRQLVAVTRHPQGWSREPRNHVATFVRQWRI